MDRSVIEGVLFDLFETLVTESEASPPRGGALGARFGVDADLYRCEWKSRRLEIVLGRRSFCDVLDQCVRALGVVPDATMLQDIRLERMSAKSAILCSIEPSIVSMLTSLRARGMRLAVVTNCFAEDVASWNDSPLCALVDAVVFSFAVGLAKPDPRIYRVACQELGIFPVKALYVGDGGDDELVGARNAGLKVQRALWYLKRWRHTSLRQGDPGLWYATDVLRFVEAV